MNRQSFYNESLGESTNAGTGWDVKVSLDFTPAPGARYWAIATAEVLNTAGTGDTPECRLLLSEGTLDDQVMSIARGQDATDWMSAFCVLPLSAAYLGEMPETVELDVVFRAAIGTPTGGTSKIRNARISVIEAHADDGLAFGFGGSSSSTSAQDALELSLNVPTTGDYVILAYCVASNDSSGEPTVVRLSVDGTVHNSVRVGIAGAGEQYPWIAHPTVNLAAGTRTLKIQYNAYLAGTASVSQCRIVALRGDRFDNVYSAASNGTSSTTESTYQDKTTLTQTPVSGTRAHLILASGAVGRAGGTTTLSGWRVLQDSTTLQEGQYTTPGINPYARFLCATIASLAASSTTWKTQFKTAGVGTARILESGITVLQVGGPIPIGAIAMHHRRQRSA